MSLNQTKSTSATTPATPTLKEPPPKTQTTIEPSQYQPIFSWDRLLVTTFIILPVCGYYWEELVQQMDGSKLNAFIIVSFAIMCGLVDLNKNMTGQPEADHDDDDH